MPVKRKVSPSLEDYLEAIYWIASQKGAAKAKDIAGRLKVSGASVTGALRTLSKKGLVNYAPYDVITLTAEGDEIARRVGRKHETLRDFFVDVLGVDEAEADGAACEMEHGLPSSIRLKLERFVEKQKTRTGGRRR